MDPDSPQSQITDSQTTDDTEHMHLADNVQNIENTENIDSTHTQGIPEGKETRDDAYTTENMPAFDSTHSTENTLSTENTHSTENKQSTENAPTTDRKHSTEDPHTTVNTHSSENTEKDEVEEEEEEEMGSIENRVRVRVTRIKHAAPTDGGTSLTGEGTEDKKMLELPEEQRKQLETTVKSELEKAGLETQGTFSSSRNSIYSSYKLRSKVLMGKGEPNEAFVNEYVSLKFVVILIKVILLK